MIRNYIESPGGKLLFIFHIIIYCIIFFIFLSAHEQENYQVFIDGLHLMK